MSDREFEEARAALAENQRRMAHTIGRLEATYEGLPKDEGLIAEIVAETGADRNRVVKNLEAIAKRELARLSEDHPDPGPTDDGPTDPAVKRFRQMLGGDGA